MAATHHSLNGLIISANPASFPLTLSLSLSLSLSFCQVTGQLMAEKLRYLSSFNQAPSHATAQARRGKKKVCQQWCQKLQFFTEQLGVSSQRSDVRIHYGSATANCFKVKVTDLTALYFKWQAQILVANVEGACSGGCGWNCSTLGGMLVRVEQWFIRDEGGQKKKEERRRCLDPCLCGESKASVAVNTLSCPSSQYRK